MSCTVAFGYWFEGRGVSSSAKVTRGLWVEAFLKATFGACCLQRRSRVDDVQTMGNFGSKRLLSQSLGEAECAKSQAPVKDVALVPGRPCASRDAVLYIVLVGLPWNSLVETHLCATCWVAWGCERPQATVRSGTGRRIVLCSWLAAACMFVALFASGSLLPQNGSGSPLLPRVPQDSVDSHHYLVLRR